MAENSSKFLLIVYQTSKSTLLVMIPLLIISYLIGILYAPLDPLLYIFPTSGEQYSFQILEGVILVSVTVVSAFLIIIALRKKLIKLLKIIYSIIFFISTVSIFWVHSYFLETVFSIETFWLEIVGVVVGATIGVSTVYIVILEKSNIAIKNSIVFVLGLAMGSIFGTVFPIVSFISLIILISLFDIYSVFKGPINQLLKRTNMSFSKQNFPVIRSQVAIGIGDFVFYSAIVTFVSKELGPILGFISIIGILVGIEITKNMLSKYGKFPGLPIPIFLSILLVLLGWVLSEYVVFF